MTTKAPIGRFDNEVPKRPWPVSVRFADDTSDFITHDGTRISPFRSPPLAPALPDTPWLQVLHPVKELRRLDLMNPDPRCIDFGHMATALSRVARFGAQTTKGTYTVAQHSVEGANAILRDTGNRLAAAAFLLHDGHEAYMGDIATPVAEALRAHADAVTGTVLQHDRDGLLHTHAGDIVKSAVASLKTVLDSAIYAAAGLPWPLSPEVRAIVKEYDARMCQTERTARLQESPEPWPMYDDLVPVQGCDLFEFQAGTISSFFAQSCRDLLPALGGTIDA